MRKRKHRNHFSSASAHNPKSQRKSIPSIIAKCGYTHTTARAVISGPHKAGGAGFLHWEWLQGEGQIQTFLKHWRTNSDISTALHIAMAWYQYYVAARRGLSTLSVPQHRGPICSSKMVTISTTLSHNDEWIIQTLRILCRASPTRTWQPRVDV